PGEGIIGRAFKERRVMAYPASAGEAPDPFIEKFPVREAIAVPVRAEGDIAGVLYVGRRQQSAPFSGSDILLLLVIADRVAGGVLHRAWLDRQARRTARLAELAKFASQLSSARPIGDLLAAACEAGCRIAEVLAAAVAVDAGHDELVVVASRGLPALVGAPAHVSARAGVTGELYAGEELVACYDV